MVRRIEADTRTMCIRRIITASGMLALVIIAMVTRLIAGERSMRTEDRDERSAGPVTLVRSRIQGLDWFDRLTGIRLNEFDLPLQPRVSHSASMLRQCRLATDEHFVGELLQWNDDIAHFRLLSGQQVRVPVSAILRVSNPAGEVDVIYDSFEVNSIARKNAPTLIDDTQGAEGIASIKVIETYRVDFDEGLDAARIEFLFHIPSEKVDGGGWQFELENRSPISVQFRRGALICTQEFLARSDSSAQPLVLSIGWHSFVAILSTDRIRMMVDQSILASMPATGETIKAFAFHPFSDNATGSLLVDAMQVRKLVEVDDLPPVPIERDSIELATGDTWFGRVKAISAQNVTLEERGKQNRVPWNKITAISKSQPKQPIRQCSSAATGLHATIQLQSFVDRPNCEPDLWNVTITRIDSELITATHPMLGELRFRWNEVAKIHTEFFGQSFLLDGRRIHLGNSLRTDFQQAFPDGTTTHSEFRLSKIPDGQPYISMNISEMEAASDNAPPASPFLADLRAGKLVTELIINDQRVGNLNSRIRFKSKSPASERIRIPFPRELLRAGPNTVELSQKASSGSQTEFDDCEIRQLRVEFELTNDPK